MGSDQTHIEGWGEATAATVYEARRCGKGDTNLWVHPMCERLHLPRRGPMTVLSDGRLLTVDAEGVAFSEDGGRSWSPTIAAAMGQDPTEPASCYVRETRAGTLVMTALDMKGRRFEWKEEKGEPGDCRMHLFAVRSEDGGRTWGERHVLVDGSNTNFFGLIQTSGGRLVVPVSHLASDPGRWLAGSLMSDDDGQTWRRSNWIDLGGHGHHDGADEPTAAELSDGQVLMLIRTNLGWMWQAFSDDGGKYWRRIEPSGIPASSSPGHLVRLGSGRLVLVWNRRDPEEGQWPLARPDEQHSEVAASWHREELSIAVSEDDAETWSEPVVIARQRGGQLSYPQVVEIRPGEFWVIPGYASAKWFDEDPIALELGISEEDLLEAVDKG